MMSTGHVAVVFWFISHSRSTETLSAPEVVEESFFTAEGAEIAEFISRRPLRTLRLVLLHTFREEPLHRWSVS